MRRSSAASDSEVTFRYFSDDALAGARDEGFVGYPAFALRAGEWSNDVLETFMRRLPPRKRSDFPRYLETLRIDPAAKFTDFALLGASEAKLPSDGFSIIDPLDDTDDDREMVIEASGYRHLAGCPLVSAGEVVSFELDPENPKDPEAVAIRTGCELVGWVNRLQTRAFRQWLADDRLSAVVDRLNGTVEAPRLYVFVSVSKASSKK
ncbi:hypothetical protein FPZ24_07070 [Sphingomonas panacisoli]|uniref:HIRAN domain-containing protein n=1 Tax=Sphingomonas panacisoli TaxID=1813879 RepID=A0A5B8LG61_9SPHN|nr:hypothetical protein [Sphingomonas panacisoli]QDZ07268.1 hypothetical protein FPZ24_07070 [Sphingomonas panacisoli]